MRKNDLTSHNEKSSCNNTSRRPNNEAFSDEHLIMRNFS